MATIQQEQAIAQKHGIEYKIENYGQIEALAFNEEAAEIDALEVGDGLTIPGYTDAYAGTIIKKTAKTITVQEDDAELLNGDKLEFHVGGFSAHCSNQWAQEYRYNPNPNGRTFKVTRRSYTDHEGFERVAWVQAGTRSQGARRAYPGRNKFHDYNF